MLGRDGQSDLFESIDDFRRRPVRALQPGRHSADCCREVVAQSIDDELREEVVGIGSVELVTDDLAVARRDIRGR
jgi:hypothetical protein